MTRSSTAWLDLLMAPLELARTAGAYAETVVDAQAVIAKRTPMIWEAFTSPWTADLPEMALMVSEKAKALDSTARTVATRSASLNNAVNAQLAAVQRLGRTGWMSPMDWWGVAERNLAVCEALIALPGEMLAPYHKGVTANAKRLGVHRTS